MLSAGCANSISSPETCLLVLHVAIGHGNCRGIIFSVCENSNVLQGVQFFGVELCVSCQAGPQSADGRVGAVLSYTIYCGAEITENKHAAENFLTFSIQIKLRTLCIVYDYLGIQSSDFLWQCFTKFLTDLCDETLCKCSTVL